MTDLNTYSRALERRCLAETGLLNTSLTTLETASATSARECGLICLEEAKVDSITFANMSSTFSAPPRNCSVLSTSFRARNAALINSGTLRKNLRLTFTSF